MYLSEGIGDFFHAVLKRLLQHPLDEGVEFCFHRHLHLRRVLIDGQHLDPYVKGYGRLYRLELDTLRLLTITNAEFQLSDGVHVEADGILVVFEVIDFILGNAVLYFLEVAQVTDIVVDCLLRVGDEFHATLEFAFTSE